MWGFSQHTLLAVKKSNRAKDWILVIIIINYYHHYHYYQKEQQGEGLDRRHYAFFFASGFLSHQNV